MQLETSSTLPLRGATAGCSRWALIERLPAGALFDPHQLRRLARFDLLGGADGAVVLGDPELEAFAEDSSPAAALIHGTLRRTPPPPPCSPGASSSASPPACGGDGGGWRVLHSLIPLHLRYHAAAEAEEARADRTIELPPPEELYLCCDGEGDGEGAADDAGTTAPASPPERTGGPCPPLALIGDEWHAACAAAAADDDPARSSASASSATAAETDLRCRWRRVPAQQRAGTGMVGGDALAAAEGQATATLRARVPVGQRAHARAVIAGTVLAVAAGTLAVLRVVWRAEGVERQQAA